jgi:hypothetical protein
MTDVARDAEVARLREDVDHLASAIARIASMLTTTPERGDAPVTVYETKNPPPASVFEFVVYPERTQ